MNPEYNLIGFHIIEKFNNNKLITWSYPCITNETKNEVLLGKFLEQPRQGFTFHRTTGNEWIYTWERWTETKVYAVALATKDYNPDKYRTFGQAMCRIYERSYNPTHLVQLYLAAYKSGCYSVQENGTSFSVDFKSYELKSHVKDLVKCFGLEVILIYNALLLKKRVLVYHSDSMLLQKNLHSIACLVDPKYRNPNDYLFPVVKNVGMDLKGRIFYVAGLKDRSTNLKDCYDIFVNLQAKTVNISPQSKEIFVMTKVHKDIAKLMVQLAESEECDESGLIQHVNKRTEEILVNLRSFAVIEADNRPMITLEELRSRKFTAAMENFLFNLAVAENIMML